MKKLLKIILPGVAILICLLVLIICNDRNSFSQAEAIAEVIKIHSDFPSKPNRTVIKTLGTGGPSGSTAKVKFTTTVKLVEKNGYLVTLTKDWGFTVNGNYAKSYWKYKVTRNSTKLVDSVDKDILINTMK